MPTIELKNRRLTPRCRVEGHCVYRLSDEPISYDGHAENVSCSGACITSHQKFLPHQKIKLTLYLSEKDVIRVNGTVAWTRLINSKYLTGIHFFNTSFETLDAIRQHAFHVNRKVMLNHIFEGWEGN